MITMPKPKHPRFTDISGNKYGRVTVISLHSKGKNHYNWNCMCDCGNYTISTATDLKTGHKSSCGCLKLEKISKLNKSHNMSMTRTYNSWCSLKSRCNNKLNENYKSYGGSGITVCDSWNSSFESFVKDMGIRPINKTIDRIDNSKGYCPDNCRWATRAVQNRNRKKMRGAYINGVSYAKTKRKWLASIGVNGSKIALGGYVNVFDAVCARKSAENKYWNSP